MSLPFIAAKLARALLTLWLVISIVFVALRVSGNPLDEILPEDATPELVQYYRTQWGLDDTVPVQYVKYWASIARGDLGVSFLSGRSAADTVLARAPATVLLTGAAAVMSLLIGLVAGVAAARHRRRALDRVIMALAASSHALPNFFLGLLLILWFSSGLHWLPSSGAGGPSALVLPAITLSAANAGSIARLTRGSFVAALRGEYVEAAMARGHSMSAVVWRELLPNALLPIIPVVGLMLGGLIGGAVITETLFAWPGIGRLLVEAVSYRDFAVVQVIVIVLTTTMVAANLIADLVYAALDPQEVAAAARDQGR